MTARRGRV